MVSMDNIHYDGNRIVMFCYPEGNIDAKTELVLDANTYEVVSPEKTNTYLAMARFKIMTLLKEGKTLPEKETSVWC